MLSLDVSVPARAPRAAQPHHIGILNDYVRIPYANGSSFASQFLYREFTRRGHDVTVLGPRDPGARPRDLPRRAILFDALPLSNHPGVFLAMPSAQALARTASAQLDVVLAQTGSGLLDLGLWLRAKAKVPLLCVNTIHLPSVYNVLLPDALNARPEITDFFDADLIPRMESLTASAYNLSDGLVVLSAGLEHYWRERGVRVPIHVIPRSVDPAVFDARASEDPFPAAAAAGARLLCVCRHAREKNIARLLEIFAHGVLPHAPAATLTLIGDGPDHDTFVALAKQLRVSDRVFFLGEFSVTDVARFYRHADVFTYTSLSETYGQVVSEAMWCGLPVVAFDDEMGVAHQVSASTGALIRTGLDSAHANALFARAVLELLRDPARKRALGEQAARVARERSSPELSIARYYDAFVAAREHCQRAWRDPGRSARAMLLARWAALHTVVAGLGRVREPALLNRHGRRQPNWEELLDRAPMPLRDRAPQVSAA
jgi:glycosyltransferase involved in cell wall biosynthesis